MAYAEAQHYSTLVVYLQNSHEKKRTVVVQIRGGRSVNVETLYMGRYPPRFCVEVLWAEAEL